MVTTDRSRSRSPRGLSDSSSEQRVDRLRSRERSIREIVVQAQEGARVLGRSVEQRSLQLSNGEVEAVVRAFGVQFIESVNAVNNRSQAAAANGVPLGILSALRTGERS